MERIATLSLVVLLALTAATTAAAEGAADLIGTWTVVSYNGDDPPRNVEMTVTFVDADTMSTKIVIDGEELGTEEVTYAATDDGQITFFPPDKPDGEQAAWTVDAEGKLNITGTLNGQEQTLVMSRA